MKTDKRHLNKLKANPANPRVIKDDKFYKLVNSVLVFPKMITVRPIAVDRDNVVLGGNQRLRVFQFIAKMTADEINKRLSKDNDFKAKNKQEQTDIMNHWAVWLDRPEVDIVDLSDFSDNKKQQFIIKDNVSYGEWDWGSLANEWDTVQLNDWGVDVWNTDKEEKEKKKSNTELLSELKLEPPYFDPTKKPNLSLRDCINFTKYNAKINAIEEAQGLSETQKETMKMFAYRFFKIDYENVANYYVYNATEEEKQIMQRLRLVLVDDGSIDGFIEDDLLKITNLIDEE